jgi:septation ring formation regulator EzrA
MAGRLGAEVAARKEVEARLETAQQAADVAMQEKQEVAAELDQVREAFMLPLPEKVMIEVPPPEHNYPDRNSELTEIYLRF